MKDVGLYEKKENEKGRVMGIRVAYSQWAKHSTLFKSS